MKKGSIVAINGNMITVRCTDALVLNEVAYVVKATEGLRLKAEIIRIRGELAELQVFERTNGLRVGDEVEFTNELLAVELGPGLLGKIYDGLQNPLPEIAEQCGFFLERGNYFDPLSAESRWDFSPQVKVGDIVQRGDAVGSVKEYAFEHSIMVPFSFYDEYSVVHIAESGEYCIQDKVCRLRDSQGAEHDLTLSFTWPVKKRIDAYTERHLPTKAMGTKVRIIDTFLPVALGGTYCIPGPFGAGKTVLQQITSRNADVDIVIIAACGERAGEVVETLREFPEIIDPRTGRSLMERTVIICNTSSMPVAAREASVYTAVTIAEYYRQMGLNILLLADSTSRWAQAMREMSGRLEEIPGEEAFPAYLESVIAAFYERAGVVQLRNGKTGSVTIGGSVSPAGGNFEEPVTQATLKVVGAFHGLSRDRAEARKYPSIDPLESWSHYSGVINAEDVQFAYRMLRDGHEIEQMMKVIGEEGTSNEDYMIYLKADFMDAVYLQQNAFDKVDQSVSPERQQHIFDMILRILRSNYSFQHKEEARQFFYRLRQKFLDYNGAEWEGSDCKRLDAEIISLLDAKDEAEVLNKG